MISAESSSYRHLTALCLCRLTLSIVGCGGCGVMPVKITSSTPAPSAMRKIDPTLAGYSTDWRRRVMRRFGRFSRRCCFKNRFNSVPINGFMQNPLSKNEKRRVTEATRRNLHQLKVTDKLQALMGPTSYDNRRKRTNQYEEQ